MSNQVLLTAFPRVVSGKKVKLLRQKGVLPGNVSGNTQSVAVQVDAKSFLQLYEKTGETALISLKVEGEEKARPVLVSSVTRDPVSNEALHVDFKQVNLSVTIEAEIPLVFTGEAPAVKAGLVFVKLRSEVPVKALPTMLPENFTIDISGLTEVGQSVTVGDLKVDTKDVEILLEPTEQLALIQAQVEEVVEELPVETVTTVQMTPEELAAKAAADAEKGEKEPAKPAKEEKKAPAKE